VGIYFKEVNLTVNPFTFSERLGYEFATNNKSIYPQNVIGITTFIENLAKEFETEDGKDLKWFHFYHIPATNILDMHVGLGIPHPESHPKDLWEYIYINSYINSIIVRVCSKCIENITAKKFPYRIRINRKE